MPNLHYIERTLVLVVGGCRLGVKTALTYSCPDMTPHPLKLSWVKQDLQHVLRMFTRWCDGL